MEKLNMGGVCAVILAAGSGSRMKADKTKQKMNIGSRTVLWRAVNAFEKSAEIESIVVVCRADEVDYANSLLLPDFKKIVAITAGGKTRAESAKIGFALRPNSSYYIAIHDSARCLITPEDVDKVVKAARIYKAATAVLPVVDTIKVVDEFGYISSTLPRENIRRAATPQIFAVDIYAAALKEAEGRELEYTDDNMLVEACGGKIMAVETSVDNIKITTSSDIEYAEYVLKKRGDENV